jgi:hypothetical protein
MTMSNIQKLVEAVQRAEKLSSASSMSIAQRARELPEKYAREAMSLSVEVPGTYGRMTEDQKALSSRLKKKLASEERARGERERDELLAGYAAELEALRAILPALAASVSIELGVMARALAAEAKNGSAS